jgi:hypothetical protein
MKIKSLSRKDALLAELAGLGGIVRGTLVRTHRKCGRRECECAKGRQHAFCYLSRSAEGRKNKIIYVKPAEEAAFDAGVAAYRRAREIIEELSQININVIKQRGEK